MTEIHVRSKHIINFQKELMSYNIALYDSQVYKRKSFIKVTK